MTDPARGAAIGSLPEELLEMIILRAVQLETDEFEFSAGGRLVGKWSGLGRPESHCVWGA
jgi:hypothetical protein